MQRYIFFVRLYAKKGKYYMSGTNFFKKMLTTAVASILHLPPFISFYLLLSPFISFYLTITFLPFTI